jgi:hypothetical protein
MAASIAFSRAAVSAKPQLHSSTIPIRAQGIQDHDAEGSPEIRSEWIPGWHRSPLSKGLEKKVAGMS